jgi:diacylglycerol kinase
MKELHRRKNAFFFAFNGLAASINREAHMRIHLLAAVAVSVMGYFFNITRTEWITLVIFICLVMMAELFNSAIEKICDLVKPEFHPTIKYIKDISAAAVLLGCAGAVIAAVIIFWPHISRVFH